MDNNQIKESVVANYGKLASAIKNPLLKIFDCCNLTETSKTVAKEIGYTDAELASAPDDSNLGIGCGNPASYADIQEGQTVLDLGSGAGFDAFIVSKEVGQNGKVIGIDLSDDMLKLARKNASKGKFMNVEFKKGDIESLPIKDNTVDHIISNCVINLSLNKDLVYNDAYRVLKDGGQLSISDIVLEKELPQKIKNSIAGQIACVSGAEKLEDYKKYISDAGFKDITIESKKSFPLELMMIDPIVANLAKEMDFDVSSEEAKDIASRVVNITITAIKKIEQV